MKRLLCMLLTAVIVFNSIPAQKVEASKLKPQLNKKVVTIEVGETVKLRVIKTKKKVTWKSNKPKIASVNKKGKITAKKEGIATITAKVGKKKYKCLVNVCEGYGDLAIYLYDEKDVDAKTFFLIPKNGLAKKYKQSLCQPSTTLNKYHIYNQIDAKYYIPSVDEWDNYSQAPVTITENIPAGDYYLVYRLYRRSSEEVDDYNKIVSGRDFYTEDGYDWSAYYSACSAYFNNMPFSKYLSDETRKTIGECIDTMNGYVTYYEEIQINPDETKKVNLRRYMVLPKIEE